MMKILIFGSRGYIGQRFLTAMPDAVVTDSDITDATAVAHVLDTHKPDCVINTAGKTGRPNIDWCEEHKEETVSANVTGPLILLSECQKRGIYFVHLGSGCVYQGTSHPSREGIKGRGYTEDDPPNFFGSFYSKTKAWADSILKEFPNTLILRLRMPFDNVPSERNLIAKLKKYNRVLDVQNSLTYIPDFLNVAQTLIKKKKTGIYHIVNPGTASPYQIMELYKKVVQPDHTFERLTLDDLPEVARTGRSNCVLSCEKLKEEGIELPDVKVRLEEAMRQLIIDN
jgi:3,5-epimerase/4-reductase